MKTVVVYGQRPEKAARLVAATLCQYGAVNVFLRESKVMAGNGVAEFSVVAADRLERLMVPRSVLLLADQSAPRRL